jgi:hypothetical protein
MDEAKSKLVSLVNDKDISAVQLMADRLGIDEDGVRKLLIESVEEGLLDGHISEDGRRFFKSKVNVQATPETVEQEYVPEFMKYNTKIGKLVAYIGIMIMVLAGAFIIFLSDSVYYQNLGLVLLLVGLIIALAGLYWIGRRKTPM